MGAQVGRPDCAVTRHATFEFYRAGPDTLRRLTADRVLGMRPLPTYKLTFAYLPLMYCLDADHDGYIMLSDILNCAKFYGAVAARHDARDTLDTSLAPFITAYTSVLFWRAATQPHGRRGIVDWTIRLLSHIGTTPGNCLSGRAVRFAFDVLGVADVVELDVPRLASALRAVSGEFGYPALGPVDAVPLKTMRAVVEGIIDGLVATGWELGYEHIDPLPFVTTLIETSPDVLWWHAHMDELGAPLAPIAQESVTTDTSGLQDSDTDISSSSFDSDPPRLGSAPKRHILDALNAHTLNE